MPIRIYALAKQLNVDSKKLVDVCEKAGIQGKGSALASLTDEEVQRVKNSLAGKFARSSAKEESGASRASEKEMPLEAIKREDYLPTGYSSSKVIPTIAPGDKGGKQGNGEQTKSALEKKPAKNNGPNIKLTSMPKPPAATPKKPEEPAAQKPIMVLPKEAIQDAKAGSKAPLEQFTKQHDKKRKQDKKTPEPGSGPVESSSPGKGRKSKRRGGGDGEVGGGEDQTAKERRLASMATTRASRQRTRRGQTQLPEGGYLGGETERAPARRKPRKLNRKGTNTAAPRKGKVSLELPCSVRDFCAATGVSTVQVLKTLLGLGTMMNINAELDVEMAELVATELDLEIQLKQAETVEESVLSKLDLEDSEESLESRPPVVTFLGHVDHGKTSLLDRLMGINVVSGEAGGITQHIRAYTIDKDGRQISFVDTPGHEAFTEMRARGANVTDIAVLVVAADDGVMPQTEEAISHAKAAEVPIVVALNKIDLPSVDPNKALQDLSTRDLLPVEWGGDIEVVRTSAITGEGLDDLLETLLVTAEIHEYKANPNRSAVGTCLEAEQEPGRGVVAKIMVRKGTLKVGDNIVCGAAHGRVKAMYDTLKPNKTLKTAGPSIPVSVTGLDVAPEAGDTCYAVPDISQAREIAELRGNKSRQQSLSGYKAHVSFEEFQDRLESGQLHVSSDEKVVLKLIVRADVRGSIEAIEKELSKISHPEVEIKIMQAMVGGVTVADVTLADASDAVIVGFNVIPDEAARALADQRGVEIRRYDIIYKITEEIKAMLSGKLKPEEKIEELGRTLVQKVYTISRLGSIAGCRVVSGKIERGCRIRVNRDGRGIGDYRLESLKREKDDVKEVRDGMECGMKLDGFNDLKEGDVLEAYKVVEVARTLS